MGLFAKVLRGGADVAASAVDADGAQEGQFDKIAYDVNKPARPRTGRTDTFSVRVRRGFKDDLALLRAQVELERQEMGTASKRVTDGEIMELMLDALKASRRDGTARTDAVPIPGDVWRALREVARHQQAPAAEIFEQLVVDKVAELGLLPRSK